MQLSKYFMRQKMMEKVLIALVPLYLMAIWLYGWRVIAVLAVVTAVGVAAEYWINRVVNKEKAKITEACLVTCALYTLTLPSTIPYWIAIVGILVALILAKGAFGGFGQNIFNPALVGRCFVYVSFPVQMTATWMTPFSTFPGGFAHFTGGVDAITASTPMILHNTEGVITPYLNMFIGNIGGSMGETSALLILLMGAYLVFTKTASLKIMLSTVLSGALFSAIFFLTGHSQVDPLFAIISGGFLFGAVFMATDPISAPRNEKTQIVFGILIGFVAIFIRTFSLFTEGIMFAILIANAFGPLLERNIKEWEKRSKAKTQAKLEQLKQKREGVSHE